MRSEVRGSRTSRHRRSAVATFSSCGASGVPIVWLLTSAGGALIGAVAGWHARDFATMDALKLRVRNGMSTALGRIRRRDHDAYSGLGRSPIWVGC